MTDQDAASTSRESRAGSTPKPARTRGPVASFARETAIILLSAIVLSWVVKTFLAQAFFIPSASMHDTLLEGDRVLVSKLAPGPFDLHRGDIVVFEDPNGWLPASDSSTNVVQDALITIGLMPQQSEDHLIKRVIGLPGDHVVSAGDGSPLEVNGVAIDESEYLAPGASPSEIAFDITVPADSLWVMGDNRQQSADSRYHLGEPGGGAVPIDDVVGTAFVTLWPFDRLGLLRNPGDVFADVPDPS
ncbi:MAG TPA: signal peptidase I [Cellulomonas sp.]